MTLHPNVWGTSNGHYAWSVTDATGAILRRGRCTTWLAAYKAAWGSLRRLEAQRG